MEQTGNSGSRRAQLPPQRATGSGNADTIPSIMDSAASSNTGEANAGTIVAMPNNGILPEAATWEETIRDPTKHTMLFGRFGIHPDELYDQIMEAIREEETTFTDLQGSKKYISVEEYSRRFHPFDPTKGELLFKRGKMVVKMSTIADQLREFQMYHLVTKQGKNAKRGPDGYDVGVNGAFFVKNFSKVFDCFMLKGNALKQAVKEYKAKQQRSAQFSAHRDSSSARVPRDSLSVSMGRGASMYRAHSSQQSSARVPRDSLSASMGRGATMYRAHSSQQPTPTGRDAGMPQPQPQPTPFGLEGRIDGLPFEWGTPLGHGGNSGLYSQHHTPSVASGRRQYRDEPTPVQSNFSSRTAPAPGATIAEVVVNSLTLGQKFRLAKMCAKAQFVEKAAEHQMNQYGQIFRCDDDDDDDFDDGAWIGAGSPGHAAAASNNMQPESSAPQETRRRLDPTFAATTPPSHVAAAASQDPQFSQLDQLKRGEEVPAVSMGGGVDSRQTNPHETSIAPVEMASFATDQSKRGEEVSAVSTGGGIDSRQTNPRETSIAPVQMASSATDQSKRGEEVSAVSTGGGVDSLQATSALTSIASVQMASSAMDQSKRGKKLSAVSTGGGVDSRQATSLPDSAMTSNSKHGFKKGDRVKLATGPFTGIETHIIKVDSESDLVDVKIPGREAPEAVHFERLQKEDGNGGFDSPPHESVDAEKIDGAATVEETVASTAPLAPSMQTGPATDPSFLQNLFRKIQEAEKWLSDNHRYNHKNAVASKYTYPPAFVVIDPEVEVPPLLLRSVEPGRATTATEIALGNDVITKIDGKSSLYLTLNENDEAFDLEAAEELDDVGRHALGYGSNFTMMVHLHGKDEPDYEIVISSTIPPEAAGMLTGTFLAVPELPGLRKIEVQGPAAAQAVELPVTPKTLATFVCSGIEEVHFRAARFTEDQGGELTTSSALLLLEGCEFADGGKCFAQSQLWNPAGHTLKISFRNKIPNLNNLNCAMGMGALCYLHISNVNLPTKAQKKELQAICDHAIQQGWTFIHHTEELEPPPVNERLLVLQNVWYKKDEEPELMNPRQLYEQILSVAKTTAPAPLPSAQSDGTLKASTLSSLQPTSNTKTTSSSSATTETETLANDIAPSASREMSEGWGDIFAWAESNWSCKECSFSNPEDALSCKACNADKPDSEAKVKAVEEQPPSEVAAGARIDSGGFHYQPAADEAAAPSPVAEASPDAEANNTDGLASEGEGSTKPEFEHGFSEGDRVKIVGGGNVGKTGEVDKANETNITVKLDVPVGKKDKVTVRCWNLQHE